MAAGTLQGQQGATATAPLGTQFHLCLYIFLPSVLKQGAFLIWKVREMARGCYADSSYF